MSTQSFVTCSSILGSLFLLCCSGADLPSPGGYTAAAGAPAAGGAASVISAGAASVSYAGSAGAPAAVGGSASVAGASGTLGVVANPVGAGGDASVAVGPSAAGSAGAAAAAPTGWTLAWQDEFDAPDGTPVDATKWTHETGGTGFGNQELEYYTDDPANSQQVAGNLVITATKDGAAAHSCWNGTCQFTSARLVTSTHYTTTYGKIEARLKTPAGRGVWPAFWMLGDNIDVVSWPTCGELDIMEAIGSDPAVLHGSMHGPGYSGATPLTASTKLPSGANLSDDFHIYSIEWAPNVVRFYLDNQLYETRTPADMPKGAVWVYDHPFFIILNVAVGGSWPGSPDASTPIPAKMLVDYVRVYNAK